MRIRAFQSSTDTLEESGSPRQGLVKGGWHSSSDLADWQVQPVGKLKEQTRLPTGFRHGCGCNE